MHAPPDDQKNLSLEERIRAAKPGAVISLHEGETMSMAGDFAERIRQERIDDVSRCLTQQISGLLVQLIRNELERIIK